MKIYEFTDRYNDIIHYILCKDFQDAKDCYSNNVQKYESGNVLVEEIPEDDWKYMYILDDNEMEPDEDVEYCKDDYCDGYKIIENFHDYSLNQTVTHIIVSSGY